MPRKLQSKKLIAPDGERCQVDILEGSFMTLGPRSYRRCNSKPTFIVIEREPNPKDGQCGSMSMCDSCLKNFKKNFNESDYLILTIEEYSKNK